MPEPDKDLPLVMAETLIEMHGMNRRIGQMQQSINRMEQVTDRAAETMLLQQQETNKRFEFLMEADCTTTMLISAFCEEAMATRQRWTALKTASNA